MFLLVITHSNTLYYAVGIYGLYGIYTFISTIISLVSRKWFWYLSICINKMNTFLK